MKHYSNVALRHIIRFSFEYPQEMVEEAYVTLMQRKLDI